MSPPFVIGVDAGTGSVRAGVFDLEGKMAGYGAHDITIWRPAEHFVEQSSDDIWSAACSAVREALAQGSIDPRDVIGLSYDATCSLVALDGHDRPLTVSPDGKPEQNVIVWMDHRAVDQAGRINARRHRLLRFVGGKLSPEMEPPKLLWIKENLPATWQNSAKFFDLADFLAYRSTGDDTRSLCTTTCKWAFDGPRGAWDRGFYDMLGMGDLLKHDKIGMKVLPMGARAGTLNKRAAAELGLTTMTQVAVGIIDAHAGGIGVMGIGFKKPPSPAQMEGILALIGGTSSCHMAVSRTPKFIKGIWGPYKSAMIPGLWLTEGGQSATGSLLDHVIRNSAAYDAIRLEAGKREQSVYEYLNGILDAMKSRDRKGSDLSSGIHMLPYFLGNRSPIADPSARGMLSGLTLDESVETAAKLYYATIQSIAYGTRHIIESMNRSGYRIRRIHACGGGTKNPVWLQEHADITGCEILLPREPEAVLLGTAVLAAVGAGAYASVNEASSRMSGLGGRYTPRRKWKAFHARRYRIFREMYKDQVKYKRMLTR